MDPTKSTSLSGTPALPPAPARGKPDAATTSLQSRDDQESRVLSVGDSLESTSAAKTSGNSERKAPSNGELEGGSCCWPLGVDDMTGGKLRVSVECTRVRGGVAAARRKSEEAWY
jgi:hypothetical protein